MFNCKGIPTTKHIQVESSHIFKNNFGFVIIKIIIPDLRIMKPEEFEPKRIQKPLTPSAYFEWVQILSYLPFNDFIIFRLVDMEACIKNHFEDFCPKVSDKPKIFHTKRKAHAKYPFKVILQLLIVFEIIVLSPKWEGYFSISRECDLGKGK